MDPGTTPTSSSRFACGIAKRSSRDVAMSTGMIARVRGIRILSVVPTPRLLERSMLPPTRSMSVRTTSIPTPRLGVGAVGRDPPALAERDRQVAHDAGERGPRGSDRLQPRLHHALLELGRDPIAALRRRR